MLCEHCHSFNPDTNKFCGMCGSAFVGNIPVSEIPVSKVTEPEEIAVPTFAEPGTFAPANRDPVREKQHYTTISGPSFLGLTDSPETDEADYLLEDDQPHNSHVGWYVFSFVAIAILAAIGVMEWRAIKTGKLSIPFINSSSAEAPKTSDQPIAQAPATLSESGQTSGAAAAPKPESDQSNDTDARPDELTTDHSATAAGTAGTANAADSGAPASSSQGNGLVSKPSTKSTADKDSGVSSSVQNESVGPKAPKATGTVADDSSSEPTSSRNDRVGRKAQAAPEQLQEKPADPRTNRMLLAGEKYLYGRGVRRDCNQAIIYFRAAAEEGNAPAMSHLGALYASGECTAQNRAVAYSWFRRAQETDPQNQWIEKNMNMVWRDMTPQERASISH